MPDYRKSKAPVPHVATKYDGFKLVKTEHPYKHQKGSGRSACFELAKDGMSVGDWAKACAAKGFDAKFVVGSLIKLQGAKEPGWLISEKDNQGRTFAEVKKVRDESPERKAKREARAKIAAEKKAKREADKKAKAEAKAKKAAEKKSKEASKEAAGAQQ